MQTSTTATLAPAHPFAAFGPAPYTFVRMQTREDRGVLMAERQAAGLPYTTNLCGGACDVCGTSIWNVYWFRSASGVEFKVGEDCADKALGSGACKRAVRERRADEIREAARVSREERLELERINNELAGHGRLTNDELALEIERLAREAQQARRDASRHFGTVGERLTMDLRYEGHYTCEPGPFGTRVIFFLRCPTTHNAVVWSTMAGWLPPMPNGDLPEKGQTIRCTFTIKAHDTYKTGEQQTIATRLGPAKEPKPKRSRKTA